MTESRGEHMASCKERALEYLSLGDLNSAVASMLSDLSKRPETALPPGSPLAQLAIIYLLDNDADAVRRWIEGFR